MHHIHLFLHFLICTQLLSICSEIEKTIKYQQQQLKLWFHIIFYHLALQTKDIAQAEHCKITIPVNTLEKEYRKGENLPCVAFTEGW